MAFTGVSPQASVFGTDTDEGIVVAKCNVGSAASAPGGYIFITNNAGTAVVRFLWVDTAGKLRIIDATVSPVVYDLGTNQITFTAFDQDVNGTVVGTQT